LWSKNMKGPFVHRLVRGESRPTSDPQRSR
jgi:hypothetical protein